LKTKQQKQAHVKSLQEKWKKKKEPYYTMHKHKNKDLKKTHDDISTMLKK
jgi:hypothetical protein